MTTTDEKVRTTDTTPQHDPKSAWTTAIDTYRERRTLRASLKSVERELSTYTTPTELQDLDAMIERATNNNDEIYGPIIERIRLRAA